MVNEEREDGLVVFAAAMLPRLWRRAYHLCGDWHEAEDLAQEALIQLYRRWSYLRRRDELEGYAYTVVLRAYLMSRRRARWRREVLLAELPETIAGDDYDNDYDGSVETAASVRMALARLGPRQRAVIMLRFWDDLSVKQVAAALDVSPGTVTSQTVRALATLRAEMSPQKPARSRIPRQRPRTTGGDGKGK